MTKTKMTARIDSDLRQLLTYIVNGETDRLKQHEWKEIAKKKLAVESEIKSKGGGE